MFSGDRERVHWERMGENTKKLLKFEQVRSSTFMIFKILPVLSYKSSGSVSFLVALHHVDISFHDESLAT